MIAALVSLRVFVFKYVYNDTSLMMKVFDRGPHLEYLANIHSTKNQYWKRVGGEWVICDEGEFPSFE
jgi:hypothetical protein